MADHQEVTLKWSGPSSQAETICSSIPSELQFNVVTTGEISTVSITISDTNLRSLRSKVDAVLKKMGDHDLS